jgi:hypothetical protein
MQKFTNNKEYQMWKANRSDSGGRSVLQTSTNKKPVLVIMIGWGFIVFAILMILDGIFGLIQSSLIQKFFDRPDFDFSNMEPMADNIPVLFSLMLFVIKHIMFFSFLLIAIAVFVLIASIFFLRLKSWARTSLEIFSWFATVVVCIKGILFMSFWISTPQGSTAFLGLFGVLAGLFIMVAIAAIPATAALTLRNKKVKEVFL